jgi:hypothetical protein
MRQKKNPRDKTVAVTAHIRTSVVERCNAFAGELGLSRGEVYTQALIEFLDKKEAEVLSMGKALRLTIK